MDSPIAPPAGWTTPARPLPTPWATTTPFSPSGSTTCSPASGTSEATSASPAGWSLAGVLGAGHWAAVARCVAGDALDACAIDTQGFRFEEVDGIRHPDFLPGGARYLDLPGFLLAAPPGPLWISGEPAPVQAMLARRHLEDPGALAFGNPGQGTEAAVDWILR